MTKLDSSQATSVAEIRGHLLGSSNERVWRKSSNRQRRDGYLAHSGHGHLSVANTQGLSALGFVILPHWGTRRRLERYLFSFDFTVTNSGNPPQFVISGNYRRESAR
jgi:hypothetical protein